jgi:hypothetical protein
LLVNGLLGSFVKLCQDNGQMLGCLLFLLIFVLYIVPERSAMIISTKAKSILPTLRRNFNEKDQICSLPQG